MPTAFYEGLYFQLRNRGPAAVMFSEQRKVDASSKAVFGSNCKDIISFTSTNRARQGFIHCQTSQIIVFITLTVTTNLVLLAGNAAPFRIDAIKNVPLLALENNIMSHKKGNTKTFF
jgi:hypothetical protein